MASSSIVVHQNNEIFRTAYRPIITTAADTVGDAAYLKAELERESWTNSGVYVGTGIYLNAYEDIAGSQTYSFNSMGYCRELICDGSFSIFHNGVAGDDIGTAFRLRISAVRYAQSANAPLIDDETDFEYSSSFYALATTTNELQALEPNKFPYTHHGVHRLILGDNTGNASQERNFRFSQNKALFQKPLAGFGFTQNWLSSYATKAYTINRSDARNDAIYVPVGLGKYWVDFYVYVILVDKLGAILGLHFFQVSSDSYLHRIPCHPDVLKDYILGNGGGTANSLIDANGNLVAAGAVIYPVVRSINGNTKVQTAGNGFSSPEFLDFSEEENNGKCNRNKFVFRNTSGGYDWLNIYGTESKNTSFESVLYDRLPENGSLHTTKTLYNTREDVFTVTSQPVDKKLGAHIEEMVTSSLVWVNVKLKNPLNSLWDYTDSRLVPIIIVPGSFEIYNTENNISFIKFSYRYSEQITLQKG